MAPPAYDPNYPDRNVSTRTIYDAGGNVIASVPLSLGCTITDDGQGNLTASAACRVMRSYYDALNRPVTVVQNLSGQAITAANPPSFGAGDQNIRMDTVYDVVGNAIASIAAREPGCAVATNLQGNVTANEHCLVTRTYFDALNRQEFVVQNLVGKAINEDAYVNGAFTLNNLVRSEQQNLITQTVYDDTGKTIAGIFYDYDPANPSADCEVTYIDGEATTFTELCIVTRNYYDEQGRSLQTVQRLYGQSIQDSARPVYDANFPDRNVPGATPYYDALGRAAASTNPLGVITRTYFDDLGRSWLSIHNLIVQPKETATPPSVQAYDPQDPKDVRAAQSHYDRAGRAYATQDALGHITRQYYDGLGRVVYSTRNLTGQPIDESYTTPPAFNADYLDQNITTRTVYDSAGQAIASIFLGAGCTVSEAGGQVYASAECVVTRAYYDSLGRTVITVHNLVVPDANHNGATNISNPAAPVRNPDFPEQNVRTDIIYDSHGQALATIDPAGVVTRTYYDRLGQARRVTRNLINQPIDEGLETPPGFDENLPDQNITTETVYDVSGNVTGQIDGSGVVTHFAYDALQRLTAVVENYLPGQTASPTVNVRTEYSYDARGNRLTIENARAKVTRFGYDALGRLAQEQDPLENGSTFAYDILGRRSSVTDANGVTTAYGYDPLGRLKTIDYPGVSEDVTFLYNPLDQRIHMTDNTGATTWSYDDMGRVVAIDDPLNPAVGYGYDGMGHRTALTYPDGRKLVYLLNALGQIQEVQERAANGWSADREVVYTYTPSGQIHTTTLPNGVVSRYAYDNVGRLTDLTHQIGEQTLSAYHYAYNPAGSRTQAVETFAQASSGSLPAQLTAEARGYASLRLAWPESTIAEEGYHLDRSTDGQNWQRIAELSADTQRFIDDGLLRHSEYWYRLTAWNSQGQSQEQALHSQTGMDPVEDLAMVTTTIDYAYDPLHRLTEANYSDGAYYHYDYDAVGNRLAETIPLGTTAYQYDDANRLESVGGVSYTWDDNGNLLSDGVKSYAFDHANRLVAITEGSGTASFVYNGLGDRVQETINGVTTSFANDLAAGLTQVLEDGTNTYLYGNGRIAQYGASGAAYFLGDALGSVRQMVDETGAVTLTRNYEPYGEETSSLGTGRSNYGYTGEWESSYTNLLYLRARFYNASTGRFLSSDSWKGSTKKPISYNAWLYGYSNPVNYTDRSGLCADQYDKHPYSCIVWPDDTLSEIAQNRGLDMQVLVAWNHIEDPDHILAGDILYLEDPTPFLQNSEPTLRADPGIMTGYVEGVSAKSSFLFLTFGVTGREVVYNFMTRERAEFTYKGYPFIKDWACGVTSNIWEASNAIYAGFYHFPQDNDIYEYSGKTFIISASAGIPIPALDERLGEAVSLGAFADGVELDWSFSTSGSPIEIGEMASIPTVANINNPLYGGSVGITAGASKSVSRTSPLGVSVMFIEYSGPINYKQFDTVDEMAEELLKGTYSPIIGAGDNSAMRNVFAEKLRWMYSQ